MDPLVQESLLNSHQQVVGQNTQEDVSLGPVLQMMEDGTFHERTVHGAERALYPCQKNVGAPENILCQVCP
jgi:hypothetical protein